jgi:hypothetical protein
MVFLGQIRGLPAIAKAAEVPNAVKSFGTTWQQSGHLQSRRLWLARFTRTYPTQLSLRRTACTQHVQFVLDALFLSPVVIFILLLSVAGKPRPGLKISKYRHPNMMARLRGIAYPKIWYPLAMRLSYNGHCNKPGLWVPGSGFFKGSRVHASRRAETGKTDSYRLASEPAISA